MVYYVQLALSLQFKMCTTICVLSSNRTSGRSVSCHWQKTHWTWILPITQFGIKAAISVKLCSSDEIVWCMHTQALPSPGNPVIEERLRTRDEVHSRDDPRTTKELPGLVSDDQPPTSLIGGWSQLILMWWHAQVSSAKAGGVEQRSIKGARSDSTGSGRRRKELSCLAAPPMGHKGQLLPWWQQTSI